MCCLNHDARNLDGAILAKAHGVRRTFALVHDELPAGALIRNGGVIFPHGSEVLRADDRVISSSRPSARRRSSTRSDGQGARRSASAWIVSSERATARSHAGATRPAHHCPARHRSVPSSPE